MCIAFLRYLLILSDDEKTKFLSLKQIMRK